MADLSLITKYFPELTEHQQQQFAAMAELYPEWNAKINVISRKDIDNLVPNHLLHSLVLAKFFGPLAPGTALMDLGCGGGFPGLPLAVYYPQCTFHLVDRIAKKLRVAEDIARQTGLGNVTFQHGDVGECHARYNYVVSRAVMPLNDLVRLVRRNIKEDTLPGNRYANGLVCLKGGDLSAECAGITRPVVEYEVSEFINLPCYDTKKIVYVPFFPTALKR